MQVRPERTVRSGQACNKWGIFFVRPYYGKSQHFTTSIYQTLILCLSAKDNQSVRFFVFKKNRNNLLFIQKNRTLSTQKISPTFCMNKKSDRCFCLYKKSVWFFNIYNKSVRLFIIQKVGPTFCVYKKSDRLYIINQKSVWFFVYK